MLMDEYLSFDNMNLLERSTTSELVPFTSASFSLMIGEEREREVRERMMTRNRAVMLMCLYLEAVAVCSKVCKLEIGNRLFA